MFHRLVRLAALIGSTVLAGHAGAQAVPEVALDAPRLVIAAPAESPVALRAVRVRTEINGRSALTSIELTFHNPNARQLEGELQFPLREGQTVARGQTLAMKTWNLRLVDMAGRPVTQLRALGRYALSWLWFLPPLAAIAPFRLSAGESVVILLGWVAVYALLSRFHPQRQFWHDAWAGTRLVSSPPLSR